MFEKNLDNFFDCDFEIIGDEMNEETDIFSCISRWGKESMRGNIKREEPESESEKQRRLDREDVRSIFPSRKGENTYTYSVFAPNSRKLSGLMKDFFKKGIKFDIISDERYGNEHTITYEIYN